MCFGSFSLENVQPGKEYFYFVFAISIWYTCFNTFQKIYSENIFKHLKYSITLRIFIIYHYFFLPNIQFFVNLMR